MIESRGKKTCTTGTKITSSVQCKIACDEVSKRVAYLNDGETCYIGGNGKCRQGGRYSHKARLICKREGIPFNI